jgi:hypothetical protein
MAITDVDPVEVERLRHLMQDRLRPIISDPPEGEQRSAEWDAATFQALLVGTVAVFANATNTPEDIASTLFEAAFQAMLGVIAAAPNN